MHGDSTGARGVALLMLVLVLVLVLGLAEAERSFGRSCATLPTAGRAAGFCSLGIGAGGGQRQALALRAGRGSALCAREPALSLKVEYGRWREGLGQSIADACKGDGQPLTVMKATKKRERGGVRWENVADGCRGWGQPPSLPPSPPSLPPQPLTVMMAAKKKSKGSGGSKGKGSGGS